MTTESDLRNALGRRLADLCEWLAGALEVGELRDAETVATARNALIRWICDGWDRNAGDLHGALEHGLQDYVESCVQWTDGTRSMERDLSLSASPPWIVPEFHLIVAYTLADMALSAFKKGTRKNLFLAAMLYADAVEAREAWEKVRGPAGAREPNTMLGVMHKIVRKMDGDIAINEALPQIARVSRRANATPAARAKLANDPKQNAKVKVKLAWEARELSTGARMSDAAFARKMCEQFDLDDADNVARWFRQWRKERRTG